MTSNIGVQLPKRIIERPGLFVDCFYDTLDPESADKLECIVNEDYVIIHRYGAPRYGEFIIYRLIARCNGPFSVSTPCRFKTRRDKGAEYYDDGLTPFLKFHPDGSGELFYPSGVLAVRVCRPENRDYDMYTVLTPGGKDSLGIERESQILAIFDTMGHGVVFGEDGAARLSYNQIGGIFTDSPAGLPLVWTWNANPRESILETVYMVGANERSAEQLERMEFFSESAASRSSGNVKTPIPPSNSRNEKKKVAEVQKPVVGERQEEARSRLGIRRSFPEEDIFYIRIICMQLNKFLGLRIIDRRNISLRFSAKNKSIRIELGTILNYNREASSCMIEASDWKNDMLR
ncbi:uncharacterized protein LOC105186829 [Harpegnathos saltator]|uniref:uncharacterized protein LOC105186829 n=1 Tax=Harpegnathos saltator TaxID=610380 RepID=UPI000DBEEC9D|nr:uncharacterized protein LOC105186829 [Harpegnathos saltator]